MADFIIGADVIGSVRDGTLDALDAVQRDHPEVPLHVQTAIAEQIRRAIRAGLFGAMGVSFDG